MPALPSPLTLGLPPRFASWRREQQGAIATLCESDAETDGLCLPTGSGKTGVAFGYAQLLPPDERVLILTATKALQNQIHDQIVKEASERLDVADLRGKSNYRCDAASTGGHLEDDASVSRDGYVSVESGPCFAGVECSLKARGCRYFDAERRARDARIVVINYDKWVVTSDHLETLGRFDVVIADEAHDAAAKLGGALSVEFERGEVESLLRLPWPGDASRVDVATWVEWARTHRAPAEGLLRVVDGQLREMAGGGGDGRRRRELYQRARRLRAAVTKMASLRGLKGVASGEWVIDALDGRSDAVTIDVVWPARHAEELLWRGATKRVLMSATLRPKHMDTLGVAVERRTFTEWGSSFPVPRRPVYAIVHSPVLRLNAKTERDEGVMRRLVATADELSNARLDRRGIVHTGSYARRDVFLKHTTYKGEIITHARDSESVRRAVERYLATPPPVMIASPALSTGHDFAFRAAEFQHVLKMPFVDGRGRLVEARTAIDREYPDTLLADALMQVIGRIVRDRADQGETFIHDGHAAWWLFAHRHLFTRSVLEALRVVRADELPRPPSPLTRDR